MASGISIHIGLNTVDPEHYNGWDGRLKACEYDAHDMHAIAQAKGFDSRLILTQEATADTVTSALRDAAGALSAGDLFVLTYSGHGGQVPDTNTDEPLEDPQDETWVLYDRQLVDDELYGLWGGLPEGVRVFVLSDSCHSGSVTRGMFDAVVPQIIESGMIDDEKPRTKDLPLDVQDATYRAHEQLYRQVQSSHASGETVEIGAAVLLISGCQDNQLSLDGERNGLFTQTLLGVWDEGAFQGAYESFWKAIGAKMPPTQSPNYFRTGKADHDFERQAPFTI